MTTYILLGIVGWRLVLPGYPLIVRVLSCVMYILFGIIGVRIAAAYAKKRGHTFVGPF